MAGGAALGGAPRRRSLSLVASDVLAWALFASNAMAAGEPPSWGAAMLGHTTPQVLFSVYARYIPNRTRRDGSALLVRMATPAPEPPDAPEVTPVEPSRTPDLLPSGR